MSGKRQRERRRARAAPAQAPAVATSSSAAVVAVGAGTATASSTVLRDPAVDEPEVVPVGREGKVRHAMRLMAAARWVTGETGRELAAAWGVSLSYLEQISAEASRRVRSVEDVAIVRSVLTVALDEALEAARGKPREVAAVVDSYAGLVGASAPARHEHAARLEHALATPSRPLDATTPPWLLEPAPDPNTDKH